MCDTPGLSEISPFAPPQVSDGRQAREVADGARQELSQRVADLRAQLGDTQAQLAAAAQQSAALEARVRELSSYSDGLQARIAQLEGQLEAQAQVRSGGAHRDEMRRHCTCLETAPLLPAPFPC